MIRPLLLALPLATIAAADWHLAVDRPADWYDPAASHHGKHALGGVLIGGATYAVATLGPIDRPGRIVIATAVGLAIGAAYEVIQGRDGSAYVDPVDALWVGAGALAGAAVADRCSDAISVTLGPRGGSVTLAYRF